MSLNEINWNLLISLGTKQGYLNRKKGYNFRVITYSWTSSWLHWTHCNVFGFKNWPSGQFALARPSCSKSSPNGTFQAYRKSKYKEAQLTLSIFIGVPKTIFGFSMNLLAGFRPNSEIIGNFRKNENFYGHFIKR